jgi:hypothetical protein
MQTGRKLEAAGLVLLATVSLRCSTIEEVVPGADPKCWARPSLNLLDELDATAGKVVVLRELSSKPLRVRGHATQLDEDLRRHQVAVFNDADSPRMPPVIGSGQLFRLLAFGVDPIVVPLLGDNDAIDLLARIAGVESPVPPNALSVGYSKAFAEK